MKIVSLLPSATEICFALGLGEQIVGVTHECDYPPEAADKPKLTRSCLPESLQTHPGSNPSAVPGRSGAIDRHVRANVHAGSSLYALDVELLERLSPDLIVTQELCAVCAVSYDVVSAAAKRLRGDPRVLSLEPATLEDVYSTISTLAQLTDSVDRGKRLIELLRSGADALRVRTRELPKPRTLVLEWTDPPMSAGHWIGDLIELAGGEPVLANRGANSQTLTWDAIAAGDPEVIIVAPCGYDVPMAKSAVGELRDEPDWAGLRAVRAKQAWVIDGSAYVNRPGPRLIRTAELFAHAMHERALAPPVPVDGALVRL